MGCDKDDDDPETSVVAGNKITATVSAPNVAKVKAMVYYEGEGDVGGESIIAECDYSNGGFTLTLPENVDAKYLETLSNYEFEDGISISDKNVKTCSIDIYGYNAAGAEAGTFWYESKTCEAGFMYVDRNVTVTGSHTYSDGEKEVYNMSLVKGWNIVYMTETEKDDVYTYTATTSNPGGLSWVFYSRDDDESYQGAARFAASKKLMLRGLK